MPTQAELFTSFTTAVTTLRTFVTRWGRHPDPANASLSELLDEARKIGDTGVSAARTCETALLAWQTGASDEVDTNTTAVADHETRITTLEGA